MIKPIDKRKSEIYELISMYSEIPTIPPNIAIKKRYDKIKNKGNKKIDF